MQSDILGDILRSLVTSIPSILVYTLGIIFALVQMRRAPKAAVIVVISLLVLMLLTVVQPVVFVFVGRLENARNWFSVVSLLFRIVFLAGIAGLIFAVFCDREAPGGHSNPFVKEFASPPAAPGPVYPGPAPRPPFGGLPRPPQ